MMLDWNGYRKQLLGSDWRTRKADARDIARVQGAIRCGRRDQPYRRQVTRADRARGRSDGSLRLGRG